MRFDEKLRILADAQGDSALLSLAGANLLLCDRPTKDQENLREALQVAAVPHWVDEEILAHLLEPSLSAEAETLTALLRRLPIRHSVSGITGSAYETKLFGGLLFTRIDHKS